MSARARPRLRRLGRRQHGVADALSPGVSAWLRPLGALLAPLLAAVSLVAALRPVPALVREIADPPPAEAEGWDRPELYPGDVGIPAVVVERAEEIIPRDGLYAIAIGDQLPVASGGIGVYQALNYFLLPRRWTFDVAAAEWIITWGHSAELLGVPVVREIGVAPGVNIVEVAR